MFSDERGSLAADDPKLNVGRLLTDHGRHYARDSAKFDLDLIVVCLSGSAGYGERLFATGRDGQCDQARAGSGGQHGHLCFRGARPEVLNDSGNETVRQVRRQVELAGFDLLFAILFCGSDRDLATATIDEEINWLRERRAFLDVVIGNELEVAALRKDRGFIVKRAVFEIKGQPRSNLAPMGDLNGKRPEFPS